jgi:hypothetical protein
MFPQLFWSDWSIIASTCDISRSANARFMDCERARSSLVTCGRRHGKSFFGVSGTLVGCGHVSGLLMRLVWPLAPMLYADRIPNKRAHFREVR